MTNVLTELPHGSNADVRTAIDADVDAEAAGAKAPNNQSVV